MGRHEGEEEAGVAQPRAGGLRHGQVEDRPQLPQRGVEAVRPRAAGQRHQHRGRGRGVWGDVQTILQHCTLLTSTCVYNICQVVVVQCVEDQVHADLCRGRGGH